jgi:anti-anti-sigma regulatory factor/PAS domain-containing protein
MRIEQLEQRLADMERVARGGVQEAPGEPPPADGAEQLLKRQYEMLRALSQAQSTFIEEMDQRALFESLLNSLLALTGSKYGYIAEVLHRDGKPYIKSLALTNIAWNQETRAFYEANVATGMEFTNLKSLFGAGLISGAPVMSNSPSTDPRRCGIPEGHPPLNAFLGLPIYSGETMIGQIGLANRKGGYDDELSAYLEPLVRTCAGLIAACRNERRRKAAERALRESEARNRALLSAIPDLILRIKRDGTVLDFKPPREHPPEGISAELLGRDVRQALPAWAAQNMEIVARGLESGEVYTCEYALSVDGAMRHYESQLGGSGDDEVLSVVRDITARKRADEERRQLQDDLIRAQAAALEELSTPLIPLNAEVVVMPLIGTVDAQRAQQVMTTLLQGVATSRARVAILDITGVRVVDIQVANALIRAAQAVKLLGAEVVLTGIRAEVARTLVELHADLSLVVTRGTLESGIAYAMR